MEAYLLNSTVNGDLPPPVVQVSINPLTPKSDWHLISPDNVTPESNIKVMRIKEMITY